MLRRVPGPVGTPRRGRASAPDFASCRDSLTRLAGAPGIFSSDVPVAIGGTLQELLGEADVVVTASTSGNSWNETIGCGVPMILYCDPRQTPLGGDYAADIDNACLWCRDRESLLAAVGRLAEEGRVVVEQLRRRDASEFLRRYVLHRNDGRCIERVLEALATTRSAKVPA